MNFVNFKIAGQGIDLEEVSKALNITPKHICKKGNVNYDKITKQPFTYTEDCWTYSIEIKSIEETEEKILEFVGLFYKNKEYIQQLSNMHDVTLWITIYQDSYQYNLRFTNNVISKVSEMGIDIGITCMQL